MHLLLINSKRITDLTPATFDILVLYRDLTDTEILLTFCKNSIAVTRRSIFWQFTKENWASFVHELVCSTKNLLYNQHQKNF